MGSGLCERAASKDLHRNSAGIIMGRQTSFRGGVSVGVLVQACEATYWCCRFRNTFQPFKQHRIPQETIAGIFEQTLAAKDKTNVVAREKNVLLVMNIK